MLIARTRLGPYAIVAPLGAGGIESGISGSIDFANPARPEGG